MCDAYESSLVVGDFNYYEENDPEIRNFMDAYGLKDSVRTATCCKSDTELEWFTNYLFNRNAQVLFSCSISNLQKIIGGVPHGSILGPLLFILFFNDITYSTKDASIIKYVDDTVIYAAGKETKEISAKQPSQYYH